MTRRMTDLLRMAAVLAALAGLVVLLLQDDDVVEASPLPSGAYAVGVADTSMAVWVSPGGRAVVTADDALAVAFQHDTDGNVLDEFVVTVDGDDFDVTIDAADDLYLTAVAPVAVPDDEVVVVQARAASPQDAPTDGAVADPSDDATPLFVRGESPMRDRVEGVARTIQRGSDGVAGVARTIGGVFEGDEAEATR